MYLIVFSDKSVVLVGLKQTTISVDYTPEFHMVKTLKEISFKKGFGKYVAKTQNAEGKDVRVQIDAHGENKQHLEHLASVCAEA
ncbi:MAG: hypothetical protein ACK5JF_00240 [Oscillospiraceae bacterium]